MPYETITYDMEDGVAVVTLNRPEVLNATTDQMYRELSQVIRSIREDDGVGADVRAVDPDMKLLHRRRRLRGILNDVLKPLAALEKPVIACVNGPAVGAGFSIALACDIVLASETATFSQVFTKVGLVPDLGGLYFLPRVVGLNKAKELCFSARKIDAAEACEMGFVNRIHPAGELLAEGTKLGRELASGPSTAIGMIKTLLNKSLDVTLDQMLEYEGYAQTLAYTTPDHREGVAAFREKRPPNFRAVRE